MSVKKQSKHNKNSQPSRKAKPVPVVEMPLGKFVTMLREEMERHNRNAMPFAADVTCGVGAGQVGESTGLTPKKAGGEIPEILGELESVLINAQDAFSRLEAKIEPVLRQEPCGVNEANPIPPATTELSGRLMTLVGCAAHLVYRLHAAERRVEL